MTTILEAEKTSLSTQQNLNHSHSSHLFDKSELPLIPTHLDYHGEAQYTPTLRSLWKESRGHDQPPFKALPNPILSETMRSNMEGFHPFAFKVMRTQLLRK